MAVESVYTPGTYGVDIYTRTLNTNCHFIFSAYIIIPVIIRPAQVNYLPFVEATSDNLPIPFILAFIPQYKVKGKQVKRKAAN